MKQGLISELLNLLYPRHCPYCRKILPDQHSVICPVCSALVRPFEGSRCFRCGKPVSDGREYCRDCARGRNFEEGMGIFLYEGRMKDSILAFKYSGCQEFAQFYAAAIYAGIRDKLSRWAPHLLVPVPMHPAKERERGFNQAARIAYELSALCSIPVGEGLVAKTRKMRPQKSLNAAARRAAWNNSFRACRPAAGLRALVVDDVFTTGSTVDAVARCLKGAGAKEVYFASVCMGRDSNEGGFSC